MNKVSLSVVLPSCTDFVGGFGFRRNINAHSMWLIIFGML